MDKTIFFRRHNISRETPGYGLLELAIDYRLREGRYVTKEEVISYIESMGTKIIIPKVDDFTKKPPAEQWMIEAIRSVGFEEPLDEFLERAAKEIDG